MKYEFDPAAPDVVSVFLDPVIVEPVAPNAQVSVALSDLVITHHGAFSQFTFSGSGHVSGAIDKIRRGDGYGDVVPGRVPEPGAALVVIGVAGLLASRRKRVPRG